ncbi:MAG: PocR ligand-binding domain-containing protein [Bacillota bacterium]
MDFTTQEQIDFMEEIQKTISKVTGWSVTFVSPEGKPFCPLDVSVLPPFCRIIVNNETGIERCILSNKQASDKARLTGEVGNVTCHAGLVLLAVPIFVFDTYIGCLTGGEGLIETASPGELEKYWDAVSDLGITREEFMDTFPKLPVIPSRQYDAMAALLNTMGRHFAQTLLTSHLEKTKAEKERQLAEEANARMALEKTIKELEYKTLQAKLNPHFLFNALNAIARTSYRENAGDTEQMVYALARLLRASLSSGNAGALHPLIQEIDYINDYIYFQKCRFEERINTHLDISPDVISHPVPVFLLQPLVENAFSHGLEPLERQVTIEIRAYAAAGRLVIEVADNGPGMTKETLHKLKNNELSGLGLALVKKRLAVQYDAAADMQIYSETGKGTAVQVRIPFFKIAQ